LKSKYIVWLWSQQFITLAKEAKMSVVIDYFDDMSLAEFKKSTMTNLSHRVKVNADAGTIVVLVNLTTKAVVGVSMLDNWSENNSPCRLHSFLDEDTYDGDYKAYNKYDIRIKNLRWLMNPITFDEIRVLVGGSADYKGHTNMWKGFHSNFANVFTKSDDQTPVERYKIWAKSLF